MFQEDGSSRSQEHIKEMKIADLVLLSLFMSISVIFNPAAHLSIKLLYAFCLKSVSLWYFVFKQYFSRNVRIRIFGHVGLVEIYINFRIRTVWSEFSLGAFWIVEDAVSSCGQWSLIMRLILYITQNRYNVSTVDSRYLDFTYLE